MTDLLEVPADTEAERHVVGACLLSPEAIPTIMAALEPEDFWSLQYRAVYAACCDLAIENHPVSVAAVSSHRLCKEILREDIARLMEGVLPDDWEFWASRVVNTRKMRKLFDLGTEAHRLSRLEPEQADAAINKVELLLTTAGAKLAGDNTTVTANEAVSELKTRLERYIHRPDEITGLTTGWDRFDRILDGLQGGGVTVVYAKTSHYKTQFVLNIGHALLHQGIPSFWCTTEMPAVQVMERLLQLEAGVNIREARWNRELWRYEDLLREKAELMEDYPVWICDRSQFDIGFFRQAVMRMKRWHNIKYVMLDLVDKVSAPNTRGDEVANVKAVMTNIKDIAKQADVHIICTTHIVKIARDYRALLNPSLDLEEMAGSGAKSQDADAAISLVIAKEDPFEGRWKAMTFEEIVLATRETKELNLYASVKKNRNGELNDLIFHIDLNAGGRITPVS